MGCHSTGRNGRWSLFHKSAIAPRRNPFNPVHGHLSVFFFLVFVEIDEKQKTLCSSDSYGLVFSLLLRLPCAVSSPMMAPCSVKANGSNFDFLYWEKPTHLAIAPRNDPDSRPNISWRESKDGRSGGDR